ncbi:hemin-degrading factor [Psychromarinibacter sp. S121]|uniref:hemin-degrading factor n=1 Tax=Psychromarinibacter sp. S121 TaxID=3415127 RepID=UPI003C7BF7AB
MEATAAKEPQDLLRALEENPKARPRDLAAQLGVTEADLVAARIGLGVTRIDASPDALMPLLGGLGPVMALTRNESAVSEKTGVYDNYHSGDHAAMVLNGAIDLRIFPKYWVHGFAVEVETDNGVRRSLQVFDAAGDAVHKVILPLDADPSGWQSIRTALATGDASQALSLEPRAPVEGPKSEPAKRDILLKEWERLTDTHQFLRLTAKLRMNRLGAYRIAGAPWVRALAPSALDTALETLSAQGVEVMIFVGNRGCIQIHSGPMHTMKKMGPWQNVLDPDFNLHLRSDHVAELWAVEKPTRRGPALSLEGFDKDGALILQVFGKRTDEADHRPAFAEVVAGLNSAEDADQKKEPVA